MFAIFPTDTHCNTSQEFPASMGQESKQDFSTIMQESLTDWLRFGFFKILFNYTEPQANKFEDFFPQGGTQCYILASLQGGHCNPRFIQKQEAKAKHKGIKRVNTSVT